MKVKEKFWNFLISLLCFVNIFWFLAQSYDITYLNLPLLESRLLVSFSGLFFAMLVIFFDDSQKKARREKREKKLKSSEFWMESENRVF